MPIRNAAKAVILRGGQVLLNRSRNTMGEMAFGLPNGALYYDLPGGGQHQYETLEEAVRRECLEETGQDVAVDRLMGIYEEISLNPQLRRAYEAYAHKVCFVFLCHLSGAPVAAATEKDLDMLDSEWIDLAEIPEIPLFPTVVKANLGRMIENEGILFLGSQRVE